MRSAAAAASSLLLLLSAKVEKADAVGRGDGVLRSEARKKTVGSEVAAGYEIVGSGGGGAGAAGGGGGLVYGMDDDDVCGSGSGGAQLACLSCSRREA